MYPSSNALGHGYYIGIVVERMSESLRLLWAGAFLLCVASIGAGSHGGVGVGVLGCLGSGCLGLRFKTLRSVVAIGYCPCFWIGIIPVWIGSIVCWFPIIACWMAIIQGLW